MKEEGQKIISVTVKKPSNAGGAEIVWQNLKNKRINFENISLEEKNLPFIYKKIPYFFHLKEIFASKWLLKKAKSKNPEIIVYDKIFGWPKIKTKARKICYNHGSYTLAGLEFKRKNYFVYLIYKYFLGYFEKKSYKNAEKIIAVSESVKKEMKDYFKINKEKIHVIDNGVDLKKFKSLKNKKELRKKYSLPLNKKILFFPGRPSFGKGFDIAKKIVNELGEKYLLLVLGEKNKKEDNEKIKFTGKIPNENMPEIYNSADICLFPSRYEGNSVSVLESAACGTPLVLSNAGLMKTEETMKEFVCKYPDEYIEKIKELLEDKKEYEKASKKWNKFSKEYSIEKQINKLKKFLENGTK